MGKSDSHVFNFYLNNLRIDKQYNNVALFGQTKDNAFTSKIKASNKKFYDIQLKNWNINELPYEIKGKFDLIVCTRCAYFSKNPKKTIMNFLELLADDGILFLDWGLGDHWRFDDYKVGWVKNNEHEWSYNEDNFLWSTMWTSQFMQHPEVKMFSDNIKKFGYDNLDHAVLQEVPSVVDPIKDFKFNGEIKVNFLTLWKDNPQLYILSIFNKTVGL